ncbi:MAG: hypothetical protein AAF721_10315 [Myxococcota bacterium]
MTEALRYGMSGGKAWDEILAPTRSLSGAELELALDEIDNAVRDWPDRLRQPDRDWIMEYRRPEPRLRVVRSLDLDYAPNVPTILKVVADPNVGKLTGLSVATKRSAKKLLDALRNAPFDVGDLRMLRLYDSGVDADTMATLASNAAWSNLEVLDLAANRLKSEGFVTLAKASQFENLRILNLEFSGDQVKAAAVEAIAAAPQLQSLVVFKLSNNDRTSPKRRGKSIITSPNFHGLRCLQLRGMGLEDADLDALAEAPMLEHLEHLDLGNNNFRAAAVERLIRNPRLGRVTVLEFADNHDDLLTEAVVEAVNDAPWAPDLTSLRLGTGPAGRRLFKANRVPKEIRKIYRKG